MSASDIETSGVWQFWIDVGGTFTDAIAVSPAGRIEQLKTLSSGVVKARIRRWVNANTVESEQLQNDDNDFWTGYDCRLIGDDGSVLHTSVVQHSTAGRLQLHNPPADQLANRFELSSGEEAPLLAIRRMLQTSLVAPLPRMHVRLGTTRGTNALLTRSGAKAALLITKGFGDLPAIGNQDRPRLFDLNILKPTLLHAATVEVDERIATDGQVLRPLDVDGLTRQCQSLRQAGFQSLAICFLNAYQNSAHEQLAAEVARRVGFEHVTPSHQASPLIKLVSRTDTAIVDAYLNPLLKDYVASIRNGIEADVAELPEGTTAEGAPRAGSDLRMLASSGGLLTGASFTGKDSVLSGPAGGVVGFSRTAVAAGFPRAIGFDMGGTSTDVSRYSGRLLRCHETVKAGVRIVAPMLAIETVAAGGGSICHFDGVRLLVGPNSAGADPGPACYGKGGPLTVTDMNFWLGRLPDASFPFPLDRRAVAGRLAELCEAVNAATDSEYSVDALAEGFLQVANTHMAAAIRSISLAEGYDPRDHVLAAFGGAAPQHACSVADQLNMREVLIHPQAGVLSALGAGMADVVRHAERAVYADESRCDAIERESICRELKAIAIRSVVDEGLPPEQVETLSWIDLRYHGVDASLTLPLDDQTLRDAFEAEHQRRFGYIQSDRELEVVSIRVEAIGKSQQRPPSSSRAAQLNQASPLDWQDAFFGGKRLRTPRFDRERLRFGDRFDGPAVVSDRVSTIIVDAEWTAEVMEQGELLLHRDEPLSPVAGLASEFAERDSNEAPTTADPIQLEVFNNRFAAIAEQMGIALQSTSTSVNVKERLDFSCAIFSPDGGLVVNAPHIPVHLGAMAESVRCVLADHPKLGPGDVIVTNDPYRGGSHLPDITVVTPVFADDGDSLLFLTASRAHHSEIGGVTPGSMPPFSRTLNEEGVLLPSLFAVRDGESQLDAIRQHLEQADYPSRSPAQNIADIEAQIAANHLGSVALRDLMRQFGVGYVQSYMRFIREAAARKTRQAIRNLPDGEREFSDRMDDGAEIRVRLRIAADHLHIDFSGSSNVLTNNFNANRAIVTAAVMYCLRTLLREDIPLNEGVLDPIALTIPSPSMLQPQRAATLDETPAVVGGNVETSQRIVDVLLGALDLAAASQGTMNNLLFGDSTFGYYETICGGAGATSDADGADAVHTHMTNTRITDPEVFERRLPARLLEFSVRRGSGGAGQWRGGDGIVRRIEFLKQLELSLLTQRRGPYPPYGKHGAEPGQLGQNRLVRANGEVETLTATCRVTVEPGDVLEIRTPGGGGWGSSVV